MVASHLEASVNALAEARRSNTQIDGLARAPASTDEAHAIQDAVFARLGLEIGAYKASTPVGAPEKRGLIPAGMVRQSPAAMPTVEVPHCGVEAEVAFRFLRDLPPRETPYTREEVAAATSVMPAIEVLSSRFRSPRTRPELEQLADCMINGGLVLGAETKNWSHLDLPRLEVTLTINGETVFQRTGGHPTDDPLGITVALVNMMRIAGGVKAGQSVATGSWSGMLFLKPGDTCVASFSSLGAAEVTFTA